MRVRSRQLTSWTGSPNVEVNSSAQFNCSCAVDITGFPETHNLTPNANSPGSYSKEMRDHIAAHPEKNSSTSPPPPEGFDKAGSNELRSQSAKNSSRCGDVDRELRFTTVEERNRLNDACKDEYNAYAAHMLSSSANAERLCDSFPETENLDWTFVEINNFTLIDHRWIRLRNEPQAVRRASQSNSFPPRLPTILVIDPSGFGIPKEHWCSDLERFNRDKLMNKLLSVSFNLYPHSETRASAFQVDLQSLPMCKYAVKSNLERV